MPCVGGERRNNNNDNKKKKKKTLSDLWSKMNSNSFDRLLLFPGLNLEAVFVNAIKKKKKGSGLGHGVPVWLPAFERGLAVRKVHFSSPAVHPHSLTAEEP